MVEAATAASPLGRTKKLNLYTGFLFLTIAGTTVLCNLPLLLIPRFDVDATILEASIRSSNLRNALLTFSTVCACILCDSLFEGWLLYSSSPTVINRIKAEAAVGGGDASIDGDSSPAGTGTGAGFAGTGTASLSTSATPPGESLFAADSFELALLLSHTRRRHTWQLRFCLAVVEFLAVLAMLLTVDSHPVVEAIIAALGVTTEMGPRVLALECQCQMSFYWIYLYGMHQTHPKVYTWGRCSVVYSLVLLYVILATTCLQPKYAALLLLKSIAGSASILFGIVFLILPMFYHSLRERRRAKTHEEETQQFIAIVTQTAFLSLIALNLGFSYTDPSPNLTGLTELGACGLVYSLCSAFFVITVVPSRAVQLEASGFQVRRLCVSGRGGGGCCGGCSI